MLWEKELIRTDREERTMEDADVKRAKEEKEQFMKFMKQSEFDEMK